MFRQNPIRRKRGELNLKLRLVDPTRIRRSSPTAPSTALVTVPGRTTISESTEFGPKRADYQLPLLFSMLLSDPQSPRVIKLLDRNIQWARQREDELYAAIFEGALAANQTPPDLSQAVRRYHHAFDIFERMESERDGFLYSMAWALFAGSSSNHNVSVLLDRARSLPETATSNGGTQRGPIRETLQEFRSLPSFAPAFEAYRAEEEDRIRNLHRLVVREGRMSKTLPLLLFPRKSKPVNARETVFRDYSFPNNSRDREPRQGCSHLFVNGCGLTINPDLSFFEDFYQLGGSLREVRHIALTDDSGQRTDVLLRRFQTLYDILFQEVWDFPKLRFLVSPIMAERFAAELDALMEKGIADRFVELRDGAEAELPGGGMILFRQGSLHVHVPLPQGRWSSIRFLSPPSRGTDPDVSVAPCQVSVFSVATPDDLYRAASLARRCRAKLTLFDFPLGSALWKLRPALREFLGPELPFAPIDRGLVCDLRHDRFLDSVKSFDSSRATGWSDYATISQASPPGSNEFFFFDHDLVDRFVEDADDIADSFRRHRKRRTGLFFDRTGSEHLG